MRPPCSEAGCWGSGAGAGGGRRGPCGRRAAAGGGRQSPVRRGRGGRSGGWASPKAGGGVRFAGARGEPCVNILNVLGGDGLPREAGNAGACSGLTGCASLSGPGAVGATSRSLCAGGAPSLSYQGLKDLKKTDVLHVDVRERWEIDRFGKIPASINIPRKLLTRLRGDVGCCPLLDDQFCGQVAVTEQRGAVLDSC